MSPGLRGLFWSLSASILQHTPGHVSPLLLYVLLFQHWRQKWLGHFGMLSLASLALINMHLHAHLSVSSTTLGCWMFQDHQVLPASHALALCLT